MIKKLVFVWDFLYHDFTNSDTYHYYAVDLFRPLVKIAAGLDIEELRTLKNKNGEEFSRNKFYMLSDYKNISECYFTYDISKIKQPSIDYLRTFIDEETFVFGFEMGMELRQILTDLNINFVNFWYHSWKLFDDAFLMINTNNRKIYDKLQEYKVPKEKFWFYASYWKHFSERKGELKYLKRLKENSCLFVGQTLKDKSTDKNGVMLNISHFKQEIENFSKQYAKIYYIPHPLVQYNDEIEKYLKETPYVEKLENVETYHLLMSDKIKKVMGISSSVLYEAQFFGKDITYFYKPLFKIDEEFSLNTFTSVFQDYYNPYFWADVLSVVTETNKNIKSEIWFDDISNKFRNINHLYYGYRNFNENYRFYNKLQMEIDLLNKNKIRSKIIFYNILSCLTFGKIRKKYKNKTELLTIRQNSLKI